MFKERKWTTQQIADLIGISRMGVWKKLKNAKIYSSQQQRFIKKHNTSKSRNQMSGPISKTSRNSGQKNGRKLVYPFIIKFFGPSQKYIVHHKDLNPTNNQFFNLLVLSTQKDHLLYHLTDKIVTILLDMKNFS